jgi:hypothetical protein
MDEFRVPYTGPRTGGSRGPWHTVSAAASARAFHWCTPEHEGGAGRYSFGGNLIWGRVMAEAGVREFARSLPGEWRPQHPILDRNEDHRASVWRSTEGGTILPFDPDEVIGNYRSERYRDVSGQAESRLKASARSAYPWVKPLMPRGLQIRLRRAFSRVQARTDFPRWPVEAALHDLSDFVLACVADAAGDPIPYLAPWPKGYSWALVLTHDVETAAGRNAIERVRAVEQNAGLQSSWNLVPERYAVDDALVAHLNAVGCEVGVHGLRHDGRDLASLRTLRRRLPEMRRWAERWGAVGFRAPATQRVWEWMPTLGFEYDSSYPDTDPYEPLAGGCCSWFPFFNQRLVELPYTLPQDHTVFVILRRGGQLWHEKAEHIRRRGGMALVLTHPDYMLDDQPLHVYEGFLGAYADDATAWKALPREVSAWWLRRAETSLRLVAGDWRAFGPAASEVAIDFVVPQSALGASSRASTI